MTETRRRGEELENAILDAAWSELIDRGFTGMTFEGVADRAGTSKPVLYRRWPSKESLLLATLAHRGILKRRTPPNTGSLRGDTLAALRSMDAIGDSIAGVLSSVLGSYFAETGSSLADLRDRIFGDNESGMQKIVQQAIDRGELPAEGLPARVTSLPVDLVRHELLVSLKAVPDATILDIVDNIFMPLVAVYSDRAQNASAKSGSVK